ncbi:MAG: formate dehydrogenase accessory sulfurtransferase FdhD [Anaerolineae bacterium]
MKRPATRKTRIQRAEAGRRQETSDLVAVEEPMEIQVVETRNGHEHAHSLSVTMRTPGDDFALAAGFLFAEGILQDPQDFWRIEYCVPEEHDQEFNIVSVVLKESVALDLSRTIRSFYTTSACGVCGKATLDAVKVRDPPPLPPDRPQVPESLLPSWPKALRGEQDVFDRTGGLHAAALFSEDGTLLSVHEDVGRHNAVDKLVGTQFMAGRLPRHDCAMLVSGRASFEILQKALAAGIPFIAAVGAPSSLAVDLATEFGMTLVGFLRGDRFNVYTGSQRIL